MLQELIARRVAKSVYWLLLNSSAIENTREEQYIVVDIRNNMEMLTWLHQKFPNEFEEARFRIFQSSRRGMTVPAPSVN